MTATSPTSEPGAPSESRPSSRCQRRQQQWRSTSPRWQRSPGSPSTIRRRLASISVAHQVAGFETPTSDASVRAVWSGIRRWQGMAPRKMRAARTKVITTMVAPLGDGLADARDRALLLFGFAGALRRSELVALDVEDVSEDDGGLRLVLRRSKTDQDAEGTTRGLPYGSHPATCPVRAWRRWLVCRASHRAGVPVGQSTRPAGHQAPQRPGRGRRGAAAAGRREAAGPAARPLAPGFPQPHQLLAGGGASAWVGVSSRMAKSTRLPCAAHLATLRRNTTLRATPRRPGRGRDPGCGGHARRRSSGL